MKSQRESTPENILLNEGQCAAQPESKVVKSSTEIPGLMQFAKQIRPFEALGKVCQITFRSLSRQSIHQALGCQEAAFHCGMAALYLGCIESSCITTNYQSTRKMHPWQRVQPPLDDGPGTKADAFATLDYLADYRVVLETLKLIIGADMWVAVTQIHNQAQRDPVVFGMVEKSATGGSIGVSLHRVTCCVNHHTLLVLRLRYLPYLLEPNPVVLRIAILIQFKPADQLLAKMTAATFSEDGIFGMKFETWLKGWLLFPVCIKPHVAGCNSFNAAILMVEDLGSSKSRKYFGTEFCCLFGKPATEVTKGDYVITPVMHSSRYQQTGKTEGGIRSGQVIDSIAGYGSIQGSTPLFPIREQFLQHCWFKHGPGQNMCTHFRAFFEHTYCQLLPVAFRKLQQLARSCQTGRSGTDDDYVNFHRFALHNRLQNLQ